jgi:hypothetical protein
VVPPSLLYVEEEWETQAAEYNILGIYIRYAVLVYVNKFSVIVSTEWRVVGRLK